MDGHFILMLLLSYDNALINALCCLYGNELSHLGNDLENLFPRSERSLICAALSQILSDSCALDS